MVVEERMLDMVEGLGIVWYWVCITADNLMMMVMDDR